MAPGHVPFFEQLYFHVALPRNVPGKEDSNLHRIEEAILARLLDAVTKLAPHVLPEHSQHVRGLKDTLLACQVLNVDGTISKSALLREIHGLDSQKMLVLYISPQNCALLVYHHVLDSGEHRVVFEAFEASATCDEVLASTSALQWDFPGWAVSLPLSTFSEESFQDALASFLEQASTERIVRFAAVTYKAAAPIPEIRDTSDPAVISSLLMTILEANGAVFSVPLLRKRVRDTVTFDNARKPWRRSAFYLVLRVAIQRYLYRLLGADLGRLYYKSIMCLLFEQLLEDVLKRIPLEAAFFLRQKLGRRLAKLESDANNSSGTAKYAHSHLMQFLKHDFEAKLSTTGGYLRSVWRNHRQKLERFIPTLRIRAYEGELQLRLMNSGRMLRGVLAQSASHSKPQHRAPAKLLEHYEQSVTSVKPYVEALSHHVSISRYQEDVVVPAKHSTYPEDLGSIGLNGIIQDYVQKISAADNEYPNQKSQMLLHLMELWVLMDKDAVTYYPLLEDYHPGFDADILDPIQLLTMEEMERARDVRIYLSKRYRSRSGMQSKTIFDDPADDCFAALYYDNFDFQGELPQMRQDIEDRASRDCDAKEAEWEVKSRLHEETINKRNEKECMYDIVRTWDGTNEYRHRKPCEWHNLNYKAKNIRIDIFEHPLPSYEPAAKAALFELRCPSDFAAYRDATWLILSTLCHQPADSLDRISLIREYSQLRPYVNDIKCQVALGSYKKAHLECHYANWGFPIGLYEVLRTCGLKPRYYDSLGKVWTGGRSKASFWHHFPVKLPLDSPFRCLELTYAEWPTSNEVQASQARCPEGISVHEFTAWQGLLVGTHSRWLDLLREMGSTNINFSSESTWTIVLRLVLQEGPGSAGDHSYTDVHSALLDKSFCAKLLQQVRYRLEAIHRNWREPVQMEILITILLKVLSLSPSVSIRKDGADLLRQARCITDRWRAELQSVVTEDPKVIQSAVWASLLCKRTLHTYQHLLHDSEDLRHYIDASISLQYNLTGKFNSMPYNVRNAIVQDVLFAYENRGRLEDAILANQRTFVEAVDTLWQIPGGYDVAESGLELVPGTWWILLTLESTTEDHTYYVHYNYVYGNLLIDGQEMGTLPLAYRTHPTYRHIFGTRNPIVFPSPLRGMTFTLSEAMRFGHRVHLGFRKGSLIIRAVQNDHLLEFVPREIFGTLPGSLDMPMPLIEDCYHWLDVYDGHVEIRQKDPWASKRGNWWIRWHPSGYYQAIRRLGDHGETTLLEPTSVYAQSITRIFTNFEYSFQILVFVSKDGRVTAELKRLELSFFINDDGLLQSLRLGAIVMQNQDTGTWYGLKSKILVQSTANRRQKSILIPWGSIRVRKDEPHVLVEIEMGKGIYLRYGVNEVLGRIECPPEPKLLYMKALLHAYTSHVVYDPLTTRTGTEEALYLLQTGSYQPWKPLSDEEIRTLKHLAELSPKRGYYPEDLRCMETVAWNSEFTIHMQDDRYRAVVAQILQRSSELSKFYQDQPIQALTEIPTGDRHLEIRAISRGHTHLPREDMAYSARDSRRATLDRRNVLQISKLLLEWHTPSSDGPTLISLLHDSPVVGGYDKVFQKCLLSDHIGVDLKAEWGALAQKSLNSSIEDRHSLMFRFGTMAFSDEANVDLLRVLVSFAMLPEIRALTTPQYPAYFHFRADGAPPSSYLLSFMEKAKKPFSETGFKKRSQLVIAENHHEKHVEKSCEILADSIREQWPNPDIDRQRLASVDSAHLDVDKALADVAPEWVRLTQNHELALYLEKVQVVLSRFAHQGSDMESQTAVSGTENTLASSPLYPVRLRDRDDMSLSRLLQTAFNRHIASSMASLPAATAGSYAGALQARSANIIQRPVNVYNSLSIDPSRKIPFNRHVVKPTLLQSPEIGRLRTIVASFKDPASFVQCRYAQELEVSINALQKHINGQKDAVNHKYPRINTEEIRPAKDSVSTAIDHVRNTLLQTNNPQAKWLQFVDLWPRMTTIDLLTELRATSGTVFGRGAKEALVAVGLAISKWQHLLRIQDAQKRCKGQQEQDEWANRGHTNWNPMTYPDWLLLEIDGDILLREEQVQVALATISPESGENSVLQLLMGKGKTSCILPMVATVLANQVDLARIVVPRPLLLQSAQVMQAKLGGLVNREIMHIPFSRKTPTDRTLMHLYGRLHSQLRDRNGVIIALPEHILSFKLSGLQQLCDGHLNKASTMIKIQDWLDKHARDVLDECDVSLAIRTQLIYPSGSQTTVDGHPVRWQVTQSLLHLIKDFSTTVQRHYGRSIEIVKRGNDGFPLIYFLRKDAEDYLIELLVKIICKGQMPSILPCAEYPLAVKNDVEAYISNPKVRSQVISRVIDYFRDKQHLMRTINLLRGLFVHRILIATLKKRWNVQYGLHPTRAPIAVPYLAKGVPSPAAEWGHPDVAIVLTCLSFYYQGLSMSQFKQAFEQLLKTDEPSVEYEKWFPKGVDIPRELDDYAAINAEDMRQLHELYLVVRSSVFLVDFYLNNFVFPKYAKTFKLKLQASGWNLFPSISVRGMGCRVTGFSGTNDSRHQLPMLVKQADLKQLAHTNAEVPFYLLASRNQYYVLMSHSNGVRWTELDLIDRLADPSLRTQQNSRSQGQIRILIDAGAQILEHSNKDFAKAWLEADQHAAAAVYFDDDHRAWVLYRGGNKCVPLLASPFADNLDRCVVYLDESHCRGTDLKFPSHARAALTLGQHLTKDALVQAAMRLRLLGQTQSVTFYSPPEVHQGILDRLQKDESYQPKSDDVLRWVFSQTCDTIEQLEPSYFSQTSQYMQQEQARLEYPGYLQDFRSRDAFLATVRTKESLSLKQLYEPKNQRRAGNVITAWKPCLEVIAEKLQCRKKNFQDRGSAVHASALEEVEIEQEREAEVEVETEVENIREVQQALLFGAFKVKKLHEDIEHFATFGRLVAGSDAYRPMFSVLGRTALGTKHAINLSMKSNLWISTQFSRTIETYESNDNYIRSCHWIVWSSISQKALLISPEEANELILILRKERPYDEHGSVHLVVYSAPVTRRMLHFNRLDYYAVPPLPVNFEAPIWLRVELGIFSGRLYLEWDEYYELLGYLGLDKELSQDPEKQAFAKKPLTFLHEWLALRRKGQDFEHTPMGFVTTGKPLTENHPFFRALTHDVDPDIRHQVARHTLGHLEEGHEDDDDIDHDDEDFVPAVEHVDDSEGEDESPGADEEDSFVDALEDLE